MPGEAEPALHRTEFDERLQQRMEIHHCMHTLAKAYDGYDRLPSRALGGIDARDHRLTVLQDGAGAALCFFTADLRACQVQSLAQESGKSLARFRFESMFDSVNSKRN
jgi:hypothetical protein